MKKKKPVGAIVIAILQLVFGVPNLLSFLVFAVLVVILAIWIPNLPPNNPLREFIDIYMGAMQRHVPSAIPYFIIASIAAMVMSTIMVVAAVGLLRGKKYGRTLSIAYGFIAILLVIASNVYNFTVYLDGSINAMDEAQKKIIAKNMPPGAKRPPAGALNPFGEFRRTFYQIIFGLSGVLGLIFPTAVLIVMYRPAIKQAYSDEPEDAHQPPGDADDGEMRREQYYEGDYG